jgi:FimV-like protein
MSLPGAARALGLGDIHVDSALNEPLSAQIDIVGATREELVALTAKIANREVFQRYGADRPGFLSTATFKVGMDSQGRPVLNVRSAEPFTDPVVNFLVDLRWNNGELIREYSLLLDPAGFSPSTRLASTDSSVTDRSVRAAPASAAPVAAPGPVAATRPEAPSRARAAKPVAETVPFEGAIAGQHRVASGETLRGIVRRAGARNESDAQRMMIAIFRANPHAFEGNINIMHLGAVLSMPSDATVSAIEAADAKREVRAQMTAWRLDGRPAAPHRLAADAEPTPLQASAAATAANPVADPAGTATLKGRVQSLEHELDDLHKQLENENATIQDLKQLTARAAAAPASGPATDTVHAEPVHAGPVHAEPIHAEPIHAEPVHAGPIHAEPIHAEPAQTVATVDAPSLGPVDQGDAPAAAPVIPAPVAATPAAPAEVRPAVSVEVMHAENHPVQVLAAVAPSTNQSFVSKGWLMPLLGGVALVLGGLAYRRRHVMKTLAESPVVPLPEDTYVDTPAYVAPVVTHAARTATPAPAPAARAVEMPTVPAPPAPEAAEILDELEPVAQDQTTQELAIDTELLERSYLDAMAIDTLGIDTSDTGRNQATHEEAHAAMRAAEQSLEDTATNETTGLDTVALDASELDSAVAQIDLPTAIMDTKKMDSHLASNAGNASLDYNLVDLDSTAEHIHHVQMPSQLNDHAVVSERRMNIVEVLKTAIDRDPNRRDLRMKLLETYYSAASINRKAFLEVVKKLARERDFLSPEDWKQVVKMGREIAPDDILFADPGKGDLADCA